MIIPYDKNATSIATMFHLMIVLALVAFSESPAEKMKKYHAISSDTAAKIGIIKRRISVILPRSCIKAPIPGGGEDRPEVPLRGSTFPRSTIKLWLVTSFILPLSGAAWTVKNKKNERQKHTRMRIFCILYIIAYILHQRYKKSKKTTKFAKKTFLYIMHSYLEFIDFVALPLNFYLNILWLFSLSSFLYSQYSLS